ncbi:zinc finger and BTB domain-containing protein 21 isoform X1 [Sorex araneus]|uniref:zinc finger and BTB domain-containing protein 21 isoform X1 n=1 Tax=Sorex araneus TaxID=42254 RepID=UPI0024334330|nr:zinc finger and BTB domain-containing protein 21 isoform X1 [Sorex araneus]XP_054983142.1 zinc finger and BTB domain-containing protein 21 isoform X1 [Sorex araneus]XP_054983143.1 zinc finger and BTB domain-containing protein 21 isoform X1 [Sorex araneus]XP_054983144.1 zinc finger and BTB domain-containing protein 21 isoform X1 [Sorex araneus]XP_054983145.1 zinc finger and BTB domain-containing protein 21 isoform X1 [Sorex araneus]XP_054983146.1 zinc finger and BTB domain-containing protein
MEGLLHYINPAHAISLLSALNEERLKGQLCDVLLIVGDQKFRAHKNVLAASSEYFQSLFASKESAAQSVFQLDFCEPDTFDHVLNYMYSSSLFVERGGLAAVQELGYSLGISFLTNIVSRTPQAPFPLCPGRRAALADDEDSGAQKRSVIVCQGRSEAPGHAANPGAAEVGPGHRPSPSGAAKLGGGPPQGPAPGDPPCAVASPERPTSAYPKVLEHAGPAEEPGRGSPLRRAPAGLDREAAPEKQGAGGPLPKGRALELALRRPRPPVPPLRSASETPYLLTETGRGSGTAEDRNLLYYSKLGLVIPSPGTNPGSQSIDRSGPLVKSLLRRSLSMDSQVPVYSPAIELKPSPGVPAALGDTPATVRCSPAQKAAFPECAESAGVDARAPAPQPHRLRSFSASQSTEREAPPASEVPIKTEPRSPLSDPSDIIRVTVGDVAAAGTRDLALKTEDNPKAMSRLPAKRRFQADRRLPLKKLRADGHGSPASAEPSEGAASPPLLDADFAEPHSPRDAFGELEGARPSRKFKCKHCLKIFRSTAGLHRHTNMYHNPEKPYACDICHKRFHTNFKVWTHCQTQHGIVKNPSPAASSHAVLDERFQRKLIDIVREREIKKALLLKLRRARPGPPGPSSSPAPAVKRPLRSRARGAYVCPHCGKAHRFLSQFKQHVKMHPGEKPLGAGRGAPAREEAARPGAVGGEQVYACRLCNAALSSLLEQGPHERLCRNAAVCPYCSLRFFSPELRREHEGQCEHRKLTCLECMRTFKSAFSIWRHQVEVHNQNSMAPPDSLDHNGEAAAPVPATATTTTATAATAAGPPRLPGPPNHTATTTAAKDDPVFSDSSEHVNFDSEDSCLPEDLSLSRPLRVQVKEEPAEEAEDETVPAAPTAPPEAPKDAGAGGREPGLWPCEKCGKAFPAAKQLERHQELLCSVKPFICHVCSKAFRTNFRLWSHFQSHMAQAADDPTAPKDPDACPGPTSSPSPPPLPPPPPLPKIQPLEPDSPTGLPDTPAPAPGAPTAEKLFVPQESDTLFYHAPPLSAITFKRQFMCKLCHRTFKTAFSLWSHEQTHN